MTNDVVVFAEQRDGRLHGAVKQVLTPAKALADELGGQVVAVVIGDAVDPAVEALASSGVDKIVTVTDGSLARYTALGYRSALVQAVKHVDPKLVLLPASFMGRDLAPRAAVRLGAALATDVTELKLGENQALDVTRPVYNGKALCHVNFPAERLAFASVRPNTFAAFEGGGSAAREDLGFEAAPGDDRMRCSEVVKTGGEVKDVTEADIVVTGGRSLKSEENFSIIYDLAKALDAAVGASRAACDAGYQPHSKQVGLTGKTVTPKLYIACGVSGAIQHLAGMRGSKCIVAINTDAEAPIFSVADYGIVDDMFKVVPALKEEVAKLEL